MHSLYIGGTHPYEESGIQLGMPDFDVKARTEGKLFIQQIIDNYGKPPIGGELKVKANNHDYGVYYCIEYYWDDSMPSALEYGLEVEEDGLEELAYWDDIRRPMAKAIIEASHEYLHRLEVEALRDVAKLNLDSLNMEYGEEYGRV